MRDLIADFTRGQDTIALSQIDADQGSPANDAFTFIGNQAFSGVTGQLRQFLSNGHTFVAGDVNGDGLGDFQIELAGQLSLTAADFLL